MLCPAKGANRESSARKLGADSHTSLSADVIGKLKHPPPVTPGRQGIFKHLLLRNSRGVPGNGVCEDSEPLLTRGLRVVDNHRYRQFMQILSTSSASLTDRFSVDMEPVSNQQQVPPSEYHIENTQTSRWTSIATNGRRGRRWVVWGDIKGTKNRNNAAINANLQSGNNNSINAPVSDGKRQVDTTDSESLLQTEQRAKHKNYNNEKNGHKLVETSPDTRRYSRTYVGQIRIPVRRDISQMNILGSRIVSENLSFFKRTRSPKPLTLTGCYQTQPPLETDCADSEGELREFFPAPLSEGTIVGYRDKNRNSLSGRKLKVRVIRKGPSKSTPKPPTRHSGLHLMSFRASRKLSTAIGLKRKKEKENALLQAESFAEYNRRVQKQLRIQEANIQWETYEERPDASKPTERVRFARTATLRVIVQEKLSFLNRLRGCLKKLHCFRGGSNGRDSFMEEFQLKTA